MVFIWLNGNKKEKLNSTKKEISQSDYENRTEKHEAFYLQSTLQVTGNPHDEVSGMC